MLSLAAVAVRVLYVQNAFGPRLLKTAKNVEQATGVLLAPRGALLDTNGQRLAYDVPAFMLDIDTRLFSDKQTLADALAPSMGVSVQTLIRVLSNPAAWVRWPVPVLEPVKEKILNALQTVKDDKGQFAVQDVTFTPTEQRFYPNGKFAANVFGYLNYANIGQGGLEQEYDSVLQGVNGSYSYTRDGEGFPLMSTIKVTQPVKPGDDLRLTLDQTVQGFVEHEMDDLVKQYHPEHAAIIVTNPKTGAILGMTSRPTFDPNQPGKASAQALSTNWAVNSRFEPGSTFKVMVLAAALATHSIKLNDTFMSGHTYVLGHRINDWNYVGWGRINFQQALEQSSNVGFATIALHLGWPNLMHYMKVFGFLDKTGVDLPNEVTSQVFPPSEQHQIQLATSGFGQGIAVTPMQQMAAIGAIANGGRLMKPYVVQQVIDSATGRVIRNVQPTVVNPQVVPSDVVRTVNQTMILDISKGIDGKGYLPGYDVGGKTGTAQVVNPKTGQYYQNRFIVSFIGYAPGWDPQFEVFVTLYWPKTSAGNQWGSTIATPAARQILQECLQYYRVAPTTAGVSAAATTVANVAVSKKAQYVQTPRLVGKTTVSATGLLQHMGLKASAIGAAGTIQSQWPQSGVEVPAGSTVYVWAADHKGAPLVMPDLTGTSMRTAGDILAAMGLQLMPQGTGYVTAQSVKAGQMVVAGSSVNVTLRPHADVADVAQIAPGK